MAKTYPTPPRIHGNGFIQVDLDPHRRLHIWDVRLPRQERDSSIHDHAFSFQSECKMGTLVNVPMRVYRDVPGFLNTHELYEVARVEGSEEDSLVSTGERVRFDARDAELVHPGEVYLFPAGIFHASLHLGTTVTVMRRDPAYRGGGRALVACRIGEEPDNSWIRADHAIPEWAWDLIHKYGGAP